MQVILKEEKEDTWRISAEHVRWIENAATRIKYFLLMYNLFRANNKYKQKVYKYISVILIKTQKLQDTIIVKTKTNAEVAIIFGGIC